ncbi:MULTISPECIES: DUF969 domain-containing protein [unclassified Novosphingobium]|uniref:DUF969 domain-containing protein n=1 Tax=unclassified Novosphingobium TaxID=2644732 RepID=UPI000F601A73|nr:MULTISPECIES: DUF969 domain-containing protein [unclassified Novosphingobium]MBF5092755.1 DUF969 domain-containing protein [Novosphingobium sp. NBM11]RQW42663.1 DUF969 domain-containing protein [Novosphingobium sp. LASN5T]
MWVLLGIAIIVAGFMLRFNPLLVIVAAALATGLAAGLSPVAIVAAFGKAFNDTRYVSVVWIVLPVIGMLEAYGLRERARTLIGGLRGATAGRLLAGYLLLRQATAAIGLTSVAGHPQTVRPLVAPTALAAAEAQAGDLPEAEREEIKAWAAATDNVGLFFGEDIFLAIGSILLMKGLLEQYGIVVEPFQLSVWAIPTAIAAFAVHGFRLWLLDRRLARTKGRETEA